MLVMLNFRCLKSTHRTYKRITYTGLNSEVRSGRSCRFRSHYFVHELKLGKYMVVQRKHME